VTAPTPLDPVTADDLLLDRMAARRATDQDDALATMLLAVARQCDSPLRQRPSGRRRLSRRRTLTALAALGLAASGAGMAAAVEKAPPSSAARTVQSPAAQPDERATGSSSTWGALPPRLVLHQPTGPRVTTVLLSLQAPYAVDRTAAPGTTAQVLSTKSVRVAAPPAAASAVPAVPRHPDGLRASGVDDAGQADAGRADAGRADAGRSRGREGHGGEAASRRALRREAAGRRALRREAAGRRAFWRRAFRRRALRREAAGRRALRRRALQRRALRRRAQVSPSAQRWAGPCGDACRRPAAGATPGGRADSSGHASGRPSRVGRRRQHRRAVHRCGWWLCRPVRQARVASGGRSQDRCGRLGPEHRFGRPPDRPPGRPRGRQCRRPHGRQCGKQCRRRCGASGRRRSPVSRMRRRSPRICP